MESNTKTLKIKNMIIIVLVLLVLMLSGYLVYDKIVLSDNDGTRIDKNWTGEIIDNDNSVYDVVSFDEYMNHNGTYGTVETLYFDDGTNGVKYYFIELDIDGRVYYGDYRDFSDRVFLLDNIVDIVSFANGAGDVYVEDCYTLDKEGNVYKYKLSDLVVGKVIGEKLNISNVEKLVHVDWASQENAGGNWAIVAVTKNGDYVELVRAGV